MSSLDSWLALLASFGAPARAVADAFARLEACYAEPHRHYHTLAHAEKVLAALPSRSPALALSAWLHDAVCYPRRPDNEERSADLARALLLPLGVPEGVVAETERLILLTKTHRADDADGQALLDADLAILASPPEEYDAYAAAIRREYAWVAEDAYRAGRTEVLERFLARPRICADDAAARRNLERELKDLKNPVR